MTLQQQRDFVLHFNDKFWTIQGEAQLSARSVGRSIQQQQQQQSSTTAYSTTNQTNRNFDTYNDAFEEEIACNIDALDNLQEGGSQLGGVEGGAAGSRKGSALVFIHVVKRKLSDF